MNVIDAKSDLISSDGPIAFSDGGAIDPSSFVTHEEDGTAALNLMIENVHCAGCMAKIEGAVGKLPGVVNARLNMSTRRLAVKWHEGDTDGARIVRTVSDLGYPVAPFEPAELPETARIENRRLLIALAVAGFAAGNVMLLSVSVWAGAFSGMEAATRDLFHWVSALIAMPAVAFAGMPFFRSAFAALRGKSMNMDVPISVAVILASAVSLHQTVQGAEHAYFDASITLLFFLLIGRYLDHRARSSVRSTAENLITLRASSVRVVDGDSERSVPVRDVRAGMQVLVSPGERISVDGWVENGNSDVDTSLITGETTPASVSKGDKVFAGTLNISGALRIRTAAAGERTLLAEIVRLMEAAEQGQAKYVRLADRAARIYAPTVHLLAAATFVGWLFVAGTAWQPAMMAAVAVLIITCPCALGLAVPVVQVMASGILLRKGVLVKSGDGFERLAEIDTVVFDKTGTLTKSRPVLQDAGQHPVRDLALAANIARHSRHPLCQALSQAFVGVSPGVSAADIDDVQEHPGQGLLAKVRGEEVRLGNRDWCGVQSDTDGGDGSSELWLKRPGEPPVLFRFRDTVRDDAAEIVRALKGRELAVHMISGDRPAVAEDVARELGIETFEGGVRPDAKVAYVEKLMQAGHKVLMVGDGLNDAPALAAGHASMSPTSAADISQTAADIVYQGEGVAPVLASIKTARFARRLIKQNFGLAVLYNVIAVPIAMVGLASPLIAAIAMSGSSLAVTLNAMRLRLGTGMGTGK